jgi:hypothetical protein
MTVTVAHVEAKSAGYYSLCKTRCVTNPFSTRPAWAGTDRRLQQTRLQRCLQYSPHFFLSSFPPRRKRLSRFLCSAAFGIIPADSGRPVIALTGRQGGSPHEFEQGGDGLIVVGSNLRDLNGVTSSAQFAGGAGARGFVVF